MTQPPSPKTLVPKALLERKQWICWVRRRLPGKIKDDKLPICARTGSGEGFLKPENHVSYQEALEAMQRWGATGVGFVLVEGCGIIGGDLDNCRDPESGALDAWAQDIVDHAETYFEISPSGKGLRFWALGQLPNGSIKNVEAGVELYDRGRYLTFTAWQVKGTPDDVAAATHNVIVLEDRVKARKSAATGAPDLEPPSEAEAFRRYIYQQSPFGRINQAAYENQAKWVPELFPGAVWHPGAETWRVSSEDLGRPELQEGLQIGRRGIKDFSVHDMGDPRQGRRSAIDLVLEYHPLLSTAKEAAEWLAETLEIPFADRPEDGPLPKLKPHIFIENRILPPREWVVPGWVPMRKVTLLQGDGGDGKTLLMRQLQASTALGEPWIGLPVEECVSVGFYTEDDDYDVDEGQAALDAHYGRFIASTGRMFVFERDGEENELVRFVGRERKAETTPFYRQVRETVLDLKGRLLNLDVAVDLYGGNEIIRVEVRALFRFIRLLCREMNGAAVMSMHVSQSGIRSDGGHSGSTDWSNASRSRLYLNRPQDQAGEYLDPYARVLTRKKANHAPIGDRIDLRWRAGVLMRDGADEERRPAENVFMDLLDAITGENQKISPSPNATNFAPKIFMKRSPQDRCNYQLKDFDRAMQRLLQSGRLRIETYGRPSRPYDRLVKSEPF